MTRRALVASAGGSRNYTRHPPYVLPMWNIAYVPGRSSVNLLCPFLLRWSWLVPQFPLCGLDLNYIDGARVLKSL